MIKYEKGTVLLIRMSFLFTVDLNDFKEATYTQLKSNCTFLLTVYSRNIVVKLYALKVNREL